MFQELFQEFCGYSKRIAKNTNGRWRQLMTKDDEIFCQLQVSYMPLIWRQQPKKKKKEEMSNLGLKQTKRDGRKM